MNTYCLSHLPDAVLLRELAALVAKDRATTAALLAHLAEVDARKLYLPAAYPSMLAYCVGELRFSEDVACKRIQVARTSRKFPVIFTALADARLHLSAVVMLAPHLTEKNADELLAAAAGKTKPEIEQLLAERFPRSELLPLVQALPGAAPRPGQQLAPGRVGSHGGLSAPGRIETSAPRPKVIPIAPERFALQLTIGQSTYEKLQYAQALLSHQLAPGDLAAVVDRALEALIGQLEKRKFAATAKPRSRRVATGKRHIPAHVRRAVWARDGGQCTFMSDKRREAQRAAAARVAVEEPGQERDVVPWLRRLGFSTHEARRAAAQCESIPDASLEERLRLALSCLRPPHRVEKGHMRSA